MRWIVGIVMFLLIVLAAGLIAGPGMIEANLNKVDPHAPYVTSPDAKALHATLDMADLHADTLLWGRDVLERGTRGHVDVPRLTEGRFALQVFSTVTKTPRGLNYDRNTGDTDSITLLAMANAWPPKTWNSLAERALYQASRLQAAAERSPEALVLVRRKADLAAVMQKRAAGSGVVAGILATEGAHPLEGNLDNLKRLHDAGFRMIGLHHFFDNELGGSLHGVSKGGLSPFGFQAVKAMEEMGIIIDLAHSSEQVVADMLEIATKPIVISHTGVRGTCKSPRDLSDDSMKAIAAKGGLIGIGYWEGAVCDYTPAGVAKAIKYAVDLVGEDHVALGSDYDGSTTVKFDAAESIALVDALLKAGLTQDQIRKVTGSNTIRFLQEHLPD